MKPRAFLHFRLRKVAWWPPAALGLCVYSLSVACSSPRHELLTTGSDTGGGGQGGSGTGGTLGRGGNGGASANSAALVTTNAVTSSTMGGDTVTVASTSGASSTGGAGAPGDECQVDGQCAARFLCENGWCEECVDSTTCECADGSNPEPTPVNDCLVCQCLDVPD